MILLLYQALLQVCHQVRFLLHKNKQMNSASDRIPGMGCVLLVYVLFKHIYITEFLFVKINFTNKNLIIQDVLQAVSPSRTPGVLSSDIPIATGVVSRPTHSILAANLHQKVLEIEIDFAK